MHIWLTAHYSAVRTAQPPNAPNGPRSRPPWQAPPRSVTRERWRSPLLSVRACVLAFLAALQERVPFKSHVAKETRLNPPEGVTSSQYISFDDPVPYHAAVKGSGSLFSVVEAGAFRAELTTVRVGRLTLQRGREDLARIGSSQLPLNRVGLLGWYPRTQLPIVRGAQILNGNWLFCGPGMESHHRSFGPVDFLVLTLDVGDLADAAVEIIGRELTVASGTLIQPPTDLDAWLRSVIDTALRLAQTAPDVLNSPL